MFSATSKTNLGFRSLSGGLLLAVTACGASSGRTGASGQAGAGAAGTAVAEPSSGEATHHDAPGASGAESGGSAGTGSESAGAAATNDASARGGAGSSGSGGSSAKVMLAPLVTSAPGAYWKTDSAWTDASTDASADVTVNRTVIGQKWEGFGAAFNEQGWSALSSSELQQRAMLLLFSKSEGAAFAWGRIPIGANDYALDRYTLDDTGTDVSPVADESNRPAADLALSGFSLARDEQKLIPYLKAAQTVSPELRFWASPWTPPVWMKTGFRKTDSWVTVPRPSYYDGGSIKADPAILAAYAEYFTKFVQGYRARGIEIELVAPQEEPSFEQSYPSCVWDKATYAAFVARYLGPAMTEIGVKVMLGTLADADKDFDAATAVLADNAAKSFLPLIGAQWGALGWDTKIAALGSKLPVWATEHKGGNYPWNPSGFPPYQSHAPNDQAYGVESWGEIRDAINKVKVTSYNAWNTVLDSSGWSIDTSRQWSQNALLIADAGTLTATPAYYVFRHLSQYVLPGATVLGTTGGDALAFENPDSSLVVVLFNSGAANDHYVVAIGNQKLQFAMPSNGWATLAVHPR